MSTALFQPFPMMAGRRAQVWRHQPQFRRPRHFHQEPEINIVVRGTGVMGIGEHVRPVSAGDVLLFQPGQDHVLLDASTDFDLFVMALRPELAERTATASLAWKATRALDTTEIARLAEQLAALSHVRDRVTHERRIGDLFLRLPQMLAPAHVLSRRTVQAAIEAPVAASSTLAKRFHTTESYLSRHFHHDLGLTLAEHRSRMRLIQFVRLVDKGKNLTQSALEANFGSYAQCHRVFRRALGCAPRDYFSGLRMQVDDATFESVELDPSGELRLKESWL